MILHLIRHGQTQHNKDGLGLGREDVELTELGRRQAAAVASRFAEELLDSVLSSPLRRCLATAEVIAQSRGLTVQTRDELIEMDVGETEGLSFATIRERFPGFIEQWQGPDVGMTQMPGGESLRDLQARVEPIIEELRNRPAEEVVAVVSHNLVEKVALCTLLGVELAAFRSFDVGLASVSTLSVRGERVQVVALNDRCHLRELNLDPAGRSL